MMIPARWIAGRRVKFRKFQFRKFWKQGLAEPGVSTAGFDFHRVLGPMKRHCICPFANLPSDAKPWSHVAYESFQNPQFCFPGTPEYVAPSITEVTKQLQNLTTTGLRGGAAGAAASRRKYGERVSEADLLQGPQELLSNAIPKQKPSSQPVEPESLCHKLQALLDRAKRQPQFDLLGALNKLVAEEMKKNS